VPKRYHVYIMASQRGGTLYIGITNDLAVRTEAHRSGKGSDFTSRYRVGRLVWYAEFADVRDAIATEKAMKRWRRAWKIRAIEEMNPEWRDLWADLNR
jgi:putative endonuclease